MSTLLEFIPFSLTARPVSALDGLLSIKFCSFLCSFRIGLTSPMWVLGRFLLRLTSRKLSTLSGIPPFSTNSFWLASLLALLVGLNLSFLIGARVVYQIHKSRSFRIRRGVPQGSVFGPVLFFLFINDLLASTTSSVMCSLYADYLVIIWFSSSSIPAAAEATQRTLIRLDRRTEYWRLPLNPSKYEVSSLWISTKLISNPTSSNSTSALSSYERTLRLPTSFPISGLARHGVKPRHCRSSWRAFAFTHRTCFLLGSLSLEPAFLHCGVQPFFSLLPL